MEYVEISKVIDIELGKTPSRNNTDYWNGENTWITIADMTQKYIEESKEKITDIAIKNTKIKKVPQNTVIMSFKLSIGKRAITKAEVYTNEAIAAFHIKDLKSLIPEYLYYALESVDFLKYTDKAVKGKTLNKEKLKKIRIPISSLSVQLKISKILNKIQKIIENKRKQIILFDELIKSRFIEMFGDFENSTPIGDVCTIKARIGWQGLSKKEYLLSGEYRLITGVDFNNGRINFENCYYINKERYEQDDNIKIKMGDVLVTKDGTIGKVAIVDKLDIPATLNSGVFVLRNKDNTLNNVFLVYSLLSEDFKRFIENIKIGATVPHLNQSSFVKHKIKLPPLYLQEEFSQFVEKTDKLKFEAEKSLKEMENLYESLMQKFFKQN